MWDAFITLMINILLFIYDLIGQNFGWAIIIFTVLVRLATYPLTARQMKSTKAMQEITNSKKYQDMQKKYKDDKEALAQKQMELYREKGVSPFGSCLPLLVQFPIIIGLYQAIIRSLAVTPLQLVNLSKHITDGVLIPINNHFWWMELSEPERLFGIPLLAILVVITSYIQTKMVAPPGGSPGDGGQGAQMTQAMTLYMPFLMGYLALTFASGLALYFIATNLATIAQYMITGQANFENILPKLPKLNR